MCSCTENANLGLDFTEAETRSVSTEITTDGVTSTIIVDGIIYSVEVDSVHISEEHESITLDDTIKIGPQDVNFSRCSIRCLRKLNEEVILRDEHYLVRQMVLEVEILYSNLVVPVQFTREIVSAICPDGSEVTPHWTHQFKVSSEYCGGDSLITNEEKHSRSYFDLRIQTYDQDKPIGTIETRVSFYTTNAPVSFGASVSDWTTG